MINKNWYTALKNRRRPKCTVNRGRSISDKYNDLQVFYRYFGIVEKVIFQRLRSSRSAGEIFLLWQLRSLPMVEMTGPVIKSVELIIKMTGKGQ